MVARRAFITSAAASSLLALTPTVCAATSHPPGTPIFLRNTPHVYIVGDDELLHWAGDTRALEGRTVLWNKRETWRYSAIARQQPLRLGDPWLTAGLLKDGDPIHLVKWEHDWEYPKLLHIPSIHDVKVFGITGANYGRMVLDVPTWEARYGIPVATLDRDTLPPATWGNWQGRPRGSAARTTYTGSAPDWPSILLLPPFGGAYPKLGFACQRGTDRWAAMLAWPGHPTRDLEPSAGNPHITYTMPGAGRQDTPQLWTGGHEWAAGWHPGRRAAFTDIPSRPYAQNLLAVLRTGVSEGVYDFTYTWAQNGRQWTTTVDLSGFATAIAWLDTERTRPEPPAPLASGNRIVCPTNIPRCRA
ncbi:MAG: hypothetical protein OXU67_10320 [Chloroflexota bacterium]|nr:hypothetical protein [Chloroflexota bacterium]